MSGRETAQYVTSRRFGEATVTLIDDGILRWNPQLPISEAVRRRVMPEAESDGTLALGLHVAHIQLGDRISGPVAALGNEAGRPVSPVGRILPP